ncbi:MAG: radical SAM protein, partial [Desulfobacterales bacterium]|nr:radical SAM protein [Desulfobacterales bacterium]
MNTDLRVDIIKASAPGPFKAYKKAMGAPPQGLFSLAAATPEDVGLTLCDETIGMRPKTNTTADIVVLLCHTPDAVHAYAMADRFRAAEKTVVMGGLHPTAMPEEALEHADAVLIGEAEGVWEDLLEDFRNNRLKRTYKRTGPVDLAQVRSYPTNLIPPSKYKHFWSVLVSRGCVHRCDFCAVPPFFSGKYRLRPIAHIVQEIKAAPTDWFELHADNLTANRDYALDLFRALAPLKINWMGEATIKLADDPELLQAAAQSGCKGLLIGIETPSAAAL